MNLSSIFYSIGFFSFALFSFLLAYVGVRKYVFLADKNKSKDLTPRELKVAISAILLLMLGVAMLLAGAIAEVG